MDHSFQVIEVKLSHDHTPNLGQEVFEWNMMGSHHEGDVYTIYGHDAEGSGKNEPRNDAGFWLRVVESNAAAAKVKPKISSYYNPSVISMGICYDEDGWKATKNQKQQHYDIQRNSPEEVNIVYVADYSFYMVQL